MPGALDIRGIKYVIGGDNGQLDAASARSEAGLARLSRAAEQTKIQFLAFGKQGELTARQLQALGYQTTDIITQLASGQALWLVLLQQGGQLRDQFGGFANVLRAVAGALTVARLASWSAGGGLLALATALTLGAHESSEFRKQLALSGNAAGLTAGRVDSMAESVARLSGNTKGNARDALLQLAQGGFTAAGGLESAGRAALVMQRLTGESVDEITKRFVGARDGVARWAVEANRSYNYVTAAQVEQIRALEVQGRTQEALRLNFEALSQTLEARTAPALGIIERGWQAVKNAASGAWDAIKSVGRDDTLEQQLDKVRRKIAGAEKSDNAFAKLGLGALRDREFDLSKQLQRQAEQAANAEQLASENALAIEEASKAHQDALLRIAEAGTAQRLAQQQAALEALARQQEQAFQRFESSPQQYRDQLIATGRAGFAAEEAQIRARIEIEQRRVAESKRDEIARSAALIALDTQLVQLGAKRAKFEADVKAFRAATPTAREVAFNPAQDFRNFERAAQAQTDAAFGNGPAAARQVAREWAQTNAELTASLIQDEQLRGQRLLELEVQQQRRRLQIGLTTAEEFKALEDGLAEYTLLRQQQLTEQLKPEWKKRLELADDAARFQRESQNQFMNATTTGAKGAFMSMLFDGQDFARNLRNVIEREMASILWDKYLAKPLATVFDSILNWSNTYSAASNLTEVGGLLALAYHSGGVAGEPGLTRRVNPMVFAGARRYHAGGLAGSEVPAILQRGERVLSRAETMRYDAARSSSAGVGLVINNVNHFGSNLTRADIATGLAAMESKIKGDILRSRNRGGAFAA